MVLRKTEKDVWTPSVTTHHTHCWNTSFNNQRINRSIRSHTDCYCRNVLGCCSFNQTRTHGRWRNKGRYWKTNKYKKEQKEVNREGKTQDENEAKMKEAEKYNFFYSRLVNLRHPSRWTAAHTQWTKGTGRPRCFWESLLVLSLATSSFLTGGEDPWLEEAMKKEITSVLHVVNFWVWSRCWWHTAAILCFSSRISHGLLTDLKHAEEWIKSREVN